MNNSVTNVDLYTINNNLYLKRASEKISELLDKINFDLLKEGFKRYPFALYNNDVVYFEKSFIRKTNDFLGNTSIVFNNQLIAIWNLESEVSLDDQDLFILTSKIIHEMYHAYQKEIGDNRFADEVYGMMYNYNSEYLTLKYHENLLLIDLFTHFNIDTLKTVLALRKKRKEINIDNFIYEEKTEIIEGMAQYIELKALQNLDKKCYLSQIKELVHSLIVRTNLFDIRFISYNIGSLFYLILSKRNILFDSLDKLVTEELINSIGVSEVPLLSQSEINNFQSEIEKYKEKRMKIINDLIVNPNYIGIELKSAHIIGFDPLNSYLEGNLLYVKNFLYLDVDNTTKCYFYEMVALVDIKNNLKIEKLYLPKNNKVS